MAVSAGCSGRNGGNVGIDDWEADKLAEEFKILAEDFKKLTEEISFFTEESSEIARRRLWRQLGIYGQWVAMFPPGFFVMEWDASFMQYPCLYMG